MTPKRKVVLFPHNYAVSYIVPILVDNDLDHLSRCHKPYYFVNNLIATFLAI